MLPTAEALGQGGLGGEGAGGGGGRQAEVVRPEARPLIRQLGAALLPGVQGDFGTFYDDVVDLIALPPVWREER